MSGPGAECVSARAVHANFVICRMNGCLHGVSKLYSELFDSKGWPRDSATRASAAHRADACSSRAKQNGRGQPAVEGLIPGYLPRLTAFFSSAPALNFATRRAAILMVAPVCGLRPLRAFRCEIENVPNPIRATRSPFLSAPVMLSTVVSIALAAWVLLMPQPAAMRSIRSALFIVAPGGGLLLLSSSVGHSLSVPDEASSPENPRKAGALGERRLFRFTWKLAASYLALGFRDCQL